MGAVEIAIVVIGMIVVVGGIGLIAYRQPGGAAVPEGASPVGVRVAGRPARRGRRRGRHARALTVED